jgi:hypothetical protein
MLSKLNTWVDFTILFHQAKSYRCIAFGKKLQFNLTNKVVRLKLGPNMNATRQKRCQILLANFGKINPRNIQIGEPNRTHFESKISNWRFSIRNSTVREVFSWKKRTVRCSDHLSGLGCHNGTWNWKTVDNIFDEKCRQQQKDRQIFIFSHFLTLTKSKMLS